VQKALPIPLNQVETCACEYVGAHRYGVEFGARRARAPAPSPELEPARAAPQTIISRAALAAPEIAVPAIAIFPVIAIAAQSLAEGDQILRIPARSHHSDSINGTERLGRLRR
jgi:hypothetical protein